MKAVLSMLLSVFLFSIYPLLASMGLVASDPIMFVLLAHFFCAVFSFASGGFLIKRRHKGKHTLASAFRLDSKKLWIYVIATGTAAACAHASLMYALLKTSQVGATIIYETWPLMAVWLTPLLVAKAWDKIKRLDYLFGFMAVIGMGFVVSAESRETIMNLDFSFMTHIEPDRLLGYGLAFIGSIGIALSTVLRGGVSQHLKDKFDGDVVLSAFMGSGFTRLASLPAFALMYFILHEPGSRTIIPADVALACFTGIMVYTMGSVFYIYSFLNTQNPNIHILYYLAPVMAIAWLHMFGFSSINDFAIIGALFVVSANLLVTIKAEHSNAYTASILSLLLGGTYCYFTTGGGLDDFYEAISVSCIFYAILIAFAWDRVIDRVKYEEALSLEIAYGLEKLRQRHLKKGDKKIKSLIADVRTILSTTDHATLGESYRSMIKTRDKMDFHPALNKIFLNVDGLVLSKMKDIMLSEVVLLCLIGGVTLFGVLTYRPVGLWPDMMAFVMAGAIVFIFFAIFDQLIVRNRSMLSDAEDSMCGVNEELFESRHQFNVISVVLMVFMLAVFAGLFAYKYGALIW